MICDECWNEPLSLEAEKIMPIQTSTGSQYLTNERILSTANGSKGLSLAATINVRQTFRLHLRQALNHNKGAC